MADIKLEYKSGIKELKIFKESGQFINNIDEFGNCKLIFDINKTDDGKFYYTKFDLKSLQYNQDKILDTNNIEFLELQTLDNTEKQDLNQILQKYNESLDENRILNQTVNALVEKYENSDDKQIIEAMKKQIVDLRIQLGQGSSLSDFSSEFPFLPL